MKLSITIQADVPKENGYDSILTVTEVLGRSLKGNEVFSVREINVVEEVD